MALTDLSIEEIAVSCGYSNALAFGKAFKLYESMTPSSYHVVNRKEARERLISAQDELREYAQKRRIYLK